MNNRVYVVPCRDYEKVDEGIRDLLDMMGGIGRFVAPGERIVLKVNLLLPAKPERAVTTHPSVVATVGRLIKGHGAIPVIADSAGSGYRHNQKTLSRLYRACEMDRAAEEAGIDVSLDTTYREVSFPEGELVKRFEVIAPVLEADGVFNLCKMKTHFFMHMTGAVKNSFGVIPGLTKPGYHATLSDPSRFANMLLDLSQYVSPRLSIMDAVVAMEADGPSAGDPRPVGLLLAATSPLALDVVASHVMGLSRQNNPVLVEAERRGLRPTRLEEVEIIGAHPSELVIPEFKLPISATRPEGPASPPWWMRALSPLLREVGSVKPRIVRDRCIACGVCRDACPVKAITLRDGSYAHIRTKDCIRCYCCHEMCPEKAVELRQGLLYRLIHR